MERVRKVVIFLSWVCLMRLSCSNQHHPNSLCLVKLWTGDTTRPLLWQEVWKGFDSLLAMVVPPGLPLSHQSKNWEGCRRGGWSLNLALPSSVEVQQNDKPYRWLSFVLLMGDSSIGMFCTWSSSSPGFLPAFVKHEWVSEVLSVHFSPSVSKNGRISLYKSCGEESHPVLLLAWEEAG